MDMKKFFACAAVLSLLIAACGDDSTSNAKGGEKGTTPEGKEIAHAGNCGVFTPWEGEGEAFVVGSKDDGYQVLLPKMEYDVELCYECLYERSGDTLHIWNSDSTREALNWFCTTDFTFDISDVDIDIKYFKYENTVFKIVDGSAPERMSSAMVITSSSSENPSSSESAESSSSGNEESSSSETLESSSATQDTTAQVKEIKAKCAYEKDFDAKDDPVMDFMADTNKIVDGPGALPPTATIYPADSEGYAFLMMEDIMLTCGIAITGADVVADGDTLFVNGKYDTSGPQADCICPTTVSFNVRYEDSFAQATWVKYDDLRVLPLLKGTKN
jgi:hypothetical protein